MAASRVRIAVVGLGRITQLMHLPHLRELHDRFTLAGLCDVSVTLARRLAERYGAPLATADYRELLAARPDAVLVAVPVPPEDIVADALAAGVHVFVEKPMAWTPARAHRLAAMSEARGRVLMVGFMKRHDPAYLLAERFAREMGELRGGMARCVLGPNDLFLRDLLQVAPAEGVDPATARAGLELSLQRTREAVGDVPDELFGAYRGLLFLASHDLSLLRGLIGGPREVTSASTWNGGRWLTATLRYDGLSVAYVMGSVAYRRFEERVELYADGQALTLSFPSPFLKHAPTLVTREYAEGSRTIEEHSVASYEEAFRRELEHFHDCVTTGMSPLTNAADAAADLDVMVAILAAAASGSRQSIAG